MTCELDDDALDIWVAENVAGWTTEDSHKGNKGEWEGWRDQHGEVGYCGVPGFTKSLDACAEAETKVAGLMLTRRYVEALKVARGYERDNESFICTWACIAASARDRCEAMWAIRNEIESKRKVAK